MRNQVAALTLALALLSPTAYSMDLKTDQDKLSYTIGVDLGKNFKKQDIAVTPEAMAQGLKDGQAGGQLLMTDEQMRQTLETFKTNLVKKKTEEFSKQAADNKAQGEKFLAENKTKKDVVTLPSGLQYRVITPGAGNSPKATDTVTVEYTGKTIDGKVFDSTTQSGKPVTFGVNQVIKGWTEALQLMKPGAKWEVFIPANLAYGDKGMMGAIGPNQTLIFEIKLNSVK